jgi:hypothetical protein
VVGQPQLSSGVGAFTSGDDVHDVGPVLGTEPCG